MIHGLFLGDLGHCGDDIVEGSGLQRCWEKAKNVYEEKRTIVEEFNARNEGKDYSILQMDSLIPNLVILGLISGNPCFYII